MSSGLDIEVLNVYYGFYIRILDPGFWNRSMAFLKFAIVGELLVVSTCNLYQTIIRQVD